MSVFQILQTKGRNVITAKASDKLADLVQTLASKRIGAILILGEHDKIEGIVSERDIVHAVAKDGPKALDFAASKVMTKGVKTCGEGDSENEIMAMMTENRIRHLPVVNSGKLAGMISIGDVVKFRIETIEREAENMKAYIAGST